MLFENETRASAPSAHFGCRHGIAIVSVAAFLAGGNAAVADPLAGAGKTPAAPTRSSSTTEIPAPASHVAAGPGKSPTTAVGAVAPTRSAASPGNSSATSDDDDSTDDASDRQESSAAKIVLPDGRQAMLDANNALRIALGLPPLAWSRHLARTARLWAKHLATDVHSLVHSQTDGMGENLAMWSSGYKAPAQLVGLWADEKVNFVHRDFPNVSRTGDWHAVGHYTQIVWRETTKVGCGIATDDRNDYLVCEYAPQGNIMAQVVY